MRRALVLSEAFSDSLPQSNPSSVWASVSRVESNIVQRLVKTAGLRAAAVSRGASSAASSENISFVELFGIHCRDQLLAQGVFGPLNRSFPHKLRYVPMEFGPARDGIQSDF